MATSFKPLLPTATRFQVMARRGQPESSSVKGTTSAAPLQAPRGKGIRSQWLQAICRVMAGASTARDVAPGRDTKPHLHHRAYFRI